MLSVIGFLIVVYGGYSYALFIKTEEQSGTNEISTYNCLDISIEGGNELNLTNAFPIVDEEGILQHHIPLQ